MAHDRIERYERLEDPGYNLLFFLAEAYAEVGQVAQAVATYERVLAEGGPLDEVIRGRLPSLRRRLEAPRPPQGGP